jgi:hypothetical protein
MPYFLTKSLSAVYANEIIERQVMCKKANRMEVPKEFQGFHRALTFTRQPGSLLASVASSPFIFWAILLRERIDNLDASGMMNLSQESLCCLPIPLPIRL